MTEQLDDSERQPCEVWSRVMGYHRPVSSWNIGKKQEWADREFFREESGFAGSLASDCAVDGTQGNAGLFRGPIGHLSCGN